MAVGLITIQMDSTQAILAAGQSNSNYRILAIRHGESIWNKLRKEKFTTEQERYHPELCQLSMDCDLTSKGIEQSKQAGIRLVKEYFVNNNEHHNHNIMMIVSPLRRALQTAQYVLEGMTTMMTTIVADDDQSNSNSNNTTLTNIRNILKVQINKNIAEVMVDPCDIGTPVVLLQQEFSHMPEWDFNNSTMLSSEDDKSSSTSAAASTNASNDDDGNGCWWYGGYNQSITLERMINHDKYPNGREPEMNVLKRLKSFKQYLRQHVIIQQKQQQQQQQEQKRLTIILICHSEIIWYLTSKIVQGEERFGQWTENGEIIDITELFKIL